MSQHTGTIKWFNTTKGYGFITPDSGGKDIFVHISAAEKAGLQLEEGMKLSFEMGGKDPSKQSAINLVAISN